MTNQQLLTCNSLWAEYQENKNGIIKEKLIERYLPLVKTVAGRIAVSLPQYVDRDDLISNGFFGLLEAIDRYDPARGVKFETYAAVRIRGSILDGIRAEDWVPLRPAILNGRWPNWSTNSAVPQPTGKLPRL